MFKSVSYASVTSTKAIKQFISGLLKQLFVPINWVLLALKNKKTINVPTPFIQVPRVG